MKAQLIEQEAEYSSISSGEPYKITSKLLGYNKYGNQVTLIIQEESWDGKSLIREMLKLNSDVTVDITFTVTKKYTL